jgi:hypothetical protein
MRRILNIFQNSIVVALLWLLMVGVVCDAVLDLHRQQHVNTAHAAFVIVFVGIAVLVTFALFSLGDLSVAAAESKPARPKWRERAYLVVHLDLRVSPPTAIFVHIYSNKARDLTLTGVPEARADLYMVEADTFQEALDEMTRIQPLYFPWATPLMTRKQ